MLILLKNAGKRSLTLQVLRSLSRRLFRKGLDAVNRMGLSPNDSLDLREVGLEIVDVGDDLIVELDVFAVGLDGDGDLFKRAGEVFLFLHKGRVR